MRFQLLEAGLPQHRHELSREHAAVEAHAPFLPPGMLQEALLIILLVDLGTEAVRLAVLRLPPCLLQGRGHAAAANMIGTETRQRCVVAAPAHAFLVPGREIDGVFVIAARCSGGAIGQRRAGKCRRGDEEPSRGGRSEGPGWWPDASQFAASLEGLSLPCAAAIEELFAVAAIAPVRVVAEHVETGPGPRDDDRLVLHLEPPGADLAVDEPERVLRSGQPCHVAHGIGVSAEPDLGPRTRDLRAVERIAHRLLHARDVDMHLVLAAAGLGVDCQPDLPGRAAVEVMPRLLPG